MAATIATDIIDMVTSDIVKLSVITWHQGWYERIQQVSAANYITWHLNTSLSCVCVSDMM